MGAHSVLKFIHRIRKIPEHLVLLHPIREAAIGVVQHSWVRSAIHSHFREFHGNFVCTHHSYKLMNTVWHGNRCVVLAVNTTDPRPLPNAHGALTVSVSKEVSKSLGKAPC